MPENQLNEIKAWHLCNFKEIRTSSAYFLEMFYQFRTTLLLNSTMFYQKIQAINLECFLYWLLDLWSQNEGFGGGDA